LPKCAESRTQYSAIFRLAELINIPTIESGTPTCERSEKRPKITGIQWLKTPTHPPSGKRSGKHSPNYQPHSQPSTEPRVSKIRRKHCDKPSCWDMHSAPVSCVISPAYTVNCLVVSSISGIYYRYLCYPLRYFRLFLFLFVYKDIHYASYSYPSVHTLVSICHTVSYKSDMHLAFLFTDFSTLLPITVSLFYYAVQPLSLVFSYWHLALS